MSKLNDLCFQGRIIDELVSLSEILSKAASEEYYEISISSNGREVKIAKSSLSVLLDHIDDAIYEAYMKFNRIKDNIIT